MTDLVSIGFTAETTGLKKAKTELNNLTNAGGKADKQLDALSRTVGIVGAALAAIGTAQLAKDVIAYSDSWKSVTSQLRQVTDSEKELLSVRKQVVALANQTRTGLEETASLYAAIDRSTTRLGYSTAQQIEITRTLNNLFISGGKSAQEMSGAIRQLSQGLESGALRGDEFNSVAENAPRILDALSAKLGIARGELREFAATGGITAEILASALSDYSAEAQRLADQTEKTFAQSMTLASNNVTEFVGGLDALNGLINDLGSGIEYASRNIDAIADAASAAATVIGGAYAIGLAKSAAAAAEKVIATNAAAKADLLALQAAERTAFAEKQAAIENLNRARSAVAKAEAEVSSSRAIQAAQIAEMRVRQSALATEIAVEKQRLAAQISDIGRMQSSTRMAELRLAEVAATKALSTAEAQLAATTASSSTALAAANQARSAAAGQAAVASEALTAATVRVTAAQAAASVTANALGAAWRFMLGPWGLVVTALGVGAAAFMSTANSSDELQASLDKQAESVNKLSEGYKNLTKAGLAESYRSAMLDLTDLEKKIAETEKTQAAMTKEVMASGIGMSMASVQYAANGESLSELKDKHAELTIKVKAMQQAFESGLPAIEQSSVAAKGHSKELQKIIDALSDERKELEMGADAWELYALRREAIAAGASSGLADQLAAEAQALRILNKELELETILTEQQADNDKDRADALSELQDRLNPVAALTKKYNQELAILKKAGADKDVKKLTEEFTKAKAELEKLPEATNEWAELTERSVDRIDSAFSDVWMNILDGADNVFGSLINSFKRMLAEMAHAALTRPIMLQIGTALGFGGLSGAASAAGTVGTAASGLGLLGSIGSGISGLGMLMGGTFGAGVASTGALLGTGSLAGLSGAFSNVGMLASSGSYAGAIGAAAPLIAGAVVAALGIDKITGGNLFGTSYKVDNQTLTLALSGGDVSGSITTDESRKKSLFRGTKRRSTTTSIETDAIDEAFSLLQSTIADAADRLGIETVTASKTIYKGFQDLDDVFSGYSGEIYSAITKSVTMPVEQWLEEFNASAKIDIKDKTQAEIEQAISDWVAKVSQQMIDGVFGDFLTGLQYEGETSVDALNRIIANMDALDIVADKLNLNFGLTGKAAALAATNIVELVGGLDALNSLTTQYYNEYFTEAERQAMLQADIAKAFESLNIAMPESKDAFRDLIESLDLSTESGQEMFAALMALSPAFAQLMNAIDADALQKAAEAEKERIEAIKNAEKEAAEAIRAAEEAERARIDAINAAYSTLQKSVAAEQALVDARLQAAQDSYNAEIERISDLRDAVESQYSALIEGVDSAEQKLRASFDAEAQAIQAAADLRISALNEELSLIERQRSAINAAYQQIVSGLSNAESNLRESFGTEQESIRNAAQLRIDALNGEAQAARDAAQVRISALNDERSLVGQSMSDMLSLASSLRQAVGIGMNTNVAASLAAARRGDFSLAQSLSVPDITDSGFGDAVAMRFAQAVQKAQVGEIADLADKQATEFDRQMAALDAQMAAIESGAESTVAAIEQQIEVINAQTEQQVSALDDQLNALLGIDDSVLSLTDAIAAYEQAQRDLSEFNLDAQLAALDEQKLLLEQQIVEVESQTEQQLNALGSQLNALLGIDTSVLSMSDSIAQYQAAKLALDEFNYAAQIEGLDALASLADMQLAEAIAQHAIDSARLDSLLETALAQVNAALGIDDSVKSVEQALLDLIALVGGGASGSLARDRAPTIIGAPVDEPVYSSAVPAPEFVNVGAPVINDFGSKATTDEIKAALVASARSNAETASILNKIYRGQITVEVAN